MDTLTTGAIRLLSFIPRMDAKSNRLLAGVVVGIGTACFAFVYFSGRLVPYSFGLKYADLSVNPFDVAENDVAFRVLSPLIGWLFLLRGELFVVVPILGFVVFLSLVYVYCRQQGLRFGASVLLVIGIGTSGIGLHVMRWPGYVDSVSFCLLAAALCTIRGRSWVIFAGLALLNHEASVFALPPLLLLHYRRVDGDRRLARASITALLLAAALLPFLLWRLYGVEAGVSGFGTRFYLSVETVRDAIGQNSRLGWIGVFSAFKLLWIFPLIAIWRNLRTGDVVQACVITCSIVLAMTQLLFAVDVTRLASLAFVGIVIGTVQVVREDPGYDLLRLVGLNLLVPSVSVWGGGLGVVYPGWL